MGIKLGLMKDCITRIKHLMKFQVPNPRIICKLNINCEKLAIGIISTCYTMVMLFCLCD